MTEDYKFERHFHWEFFAYNDANVYGEPPNQRIDYICTVTVVVFDIEENAIIAAKEVIKRDKFALKQVWECTTCRFNEINADNARKMVEALKGEK